MAKDSVRKRRIVFLIFMVVLSFFASIFSITFYFISKSPEVNLFSETSKVDYKVLLKENEFYEEKYLEKDNEYIASLIDNIESVFKYTLNLPEKSNYNYSYKIVAEINVEDAVSKNSIYNFNEELFTSAEIYNIGFLNIEKQIDIDFEKYNDIVNKFKSVYELSTATSNLDVVMYVSIDNVNNSSLSIVDKKVASYSIPLGQNTLSIENNATELKDYVRLENLNEKGLFYFLVLGLFFMIFAIVLLIYVIYYTIKTRTSKMIYEKEIKSISNNYSSYIQRISGSYDIGTSQVIKIESFNDILEIRDTLKQPILMLENEDKDGTFFIIPATNSIIYVFALRVIDIEAKMKGKEVPTYNINDIPHEDFLKNKKYTEDFIKDEITRTSMIPAVDDSNVIQGKNNKTMDLYDQLELTRSFSIDEIKKAVKEAKKKKAEEEKKKALNKQSNPVKNEGKKKKVVVNNNTKKKK